MAQENKAQASEIRYLNPRIGRREEEEVLPFQESSASSTWITRTAEFLKKFLNEQGKILPRRLTGTSQKFQKKVAQAVKRARHLAILPFVTDMYEIIKRRSKTWK